MQVKRDNKNIKKLISDSEFSVKQSGEEGLFIEGFANRSTVDRGDEVIAPDAWDLENFKKNPIILFNHGMDTLGGMPVGKAVAIEPSEDGLKIKVRMSNSQAPQIKMVRDLVEERILKAFSVGFSPNETEAVDMDGKSVTKITKAELFEVSIVGIPMNQDSIFELSEKTLSTKSIHQIKTEYLKAKGAKDALDIESKFVDGSDRKAIIESISEELDIDVLKVKDMLIGDLEFTPEVLEAFDRHLVDRVKDNNDQSAEKKADEEEKEGGGEEKESTSEEGGGSEEEVNPKKDFQECVNEKIPQLLDEGKERDQAVAQAISMCQEEGKCMLSPEGKLAAYKEVFSALDNWDGEGDLKFELSDDVVFSQDSQKQIDESEQENQNTPDTPINTDVKGEEFGSPFLEAAQQTNVLLGALINEIQGLRSELVGLKDPEDSQKPEDSESLESSEAAGDQPKDSTDDTDSTDEKSINIDYAEKKLENLNQRLKNLGG